MMVHYTADEAALYWYHTDHLGTPQALTDRHGQIAWQAQYDPFGEVVLLVNNVTQPLRFPGQYFDEETGLHYNYFRDYDPGTGRYVQSDPIGLRGGLNTYAYALLNPVNFYDFFGLAADSISHSCLRNPSLCRELGGAAAGSAASKKIAEGGVICWLLGLCSANEADESQCPDLPDDYTGENPRDGTGNRKNTDPPGSGESAEDLFDRLTGGTGKNSDPRRPEHLIGDNGIRYRPPKNGTGARIDIPASGIRPHETIHY